MSSGHVVVVGSANLDTTLRVPTVPVAGQTLLATSTAQTPGGKGANQAVAAAAAGAVVHFVGAVGDDDAGHRMRENLRARGVDDTGVAVLAEHPTGTATVIVEDSGENVIVVSLGANAELTGEHVEAALAQVSAPVLLCQLEVPLATVRAAARASAQRTVVLNPAPMAPAEELVGLLDLVDVLVPNQSELAALAGTPVPTTLDEVRDAVTRLALPGAVVVTLGAQGAAVLAPGSTDPVHVPAPAVETVDTSGAGDVFCGVLARALSQGDELLDAVREAVELAAQSTRYPGAQLPAQRTA